jgi:hypothetical protein
MVEKKKTKLHAVAVIGDQQIEIDYLTSFRYEYLCLFYVSGKGAGAMYLTHLSKETAHLPQSQLMRHLLETIGNRTMTQLIRSFDLAV